MINFFKNDLPESINLGKSIAIDTETLGLNIFYDRLCLVQISSGDGNAYLINFDIDGYSKAKNLKRILSDNSIEKIFHFARFDLAILNKTFNIKIQNIYCTKIASKLGRTYTDRHGLKELCKELLGIDLNKQEQSSYWGNDSLRQEQLKYAANDVLYLHKIKEKLDVILNREGRLEMAQKCFHTLEDIVVECDITNRDFAYLFEH